MSVRRVMGIETEYGISSHGGEYENHARLSLDVIRGAANLHPELQHVQWSYDHEDPVHDARGYHMPRAHVRSDLLTDAPALHALNVPQINGGRIYVDHAHPEYSSPEVFSPLAALTFDRAGDVLMQQACERASSVDKPLTLYRNNTDGKGVSWGSHENYQISREVPFDILASVFMTHAVSRQIYTGTGRVGIGANGEIPGFQLTQRADFFTTKIGLQTTFDRPLVNTRDESHSTDAFRRFHVIIGDANRMDVPEILKLGVTSLIFWALEKSTQTGAQLTDFLHNIELLNPVSALHEVSHDLSLTTTLELTNGEKLTAIQLQLRLRSWIYAVAAQVYDTDSRGEPLWPDEDTKQVIRLWTDVLRDLLTVSAANDDERLTLSDQSSHIEWLLKWQILESMRRRKNAQWDSPLLQAMDISWASCASDSLWNKVKAKATVLVSENDIENACTNPPCDTRAFARGELLKNYPHDVAAVSWDLVAVRSSALEDSQPEIQVIELADPAKHTQKELGDTFTPEHNIEDIREKLSA